MRNFPSVAAAVLLAVAPAPVMARNAAADAARVEVLPGWREAGRQVAALNITLAPGWKTYWRAPGEAGIPPQLDIRGSTNLKAAEFVWPVPEVFTVSGMRSIGYPGGMVLPVLLTPADPTAPIRLEAALEMGVCRDVCLPLTVRLSATLQGEGGHDPRISAALADRPLTAAKAGVRAVSCRIDPIADGLRLTARIEMPALGHPEVVAIEPGEPGIWVSDARGGRDGTALVATADLVPPAARPFALDRSRLRLTVLGGGRAVEITGCTGD